MRLGAQKVKLVCLEQRDEMPASTEEIARAEEEGVEIYNGWGLKRVLSAEDGSITGLESMNCVSVRDEQGHFNPTYGDETRVFSSDCIILATGQKVDTDFLGEKYQEELKSARGLIEVGEHRDTRAPGIYAGGRRGLRPLCGHQGHPGRRHRGQEHEQVHGLPHGDPRRPRRVLEIRSPRA